MPLPKCVQLRCKVSPSLLFYPTGAVRSLSKGEDGKEFTLPRSKKEDEDGRETCSLPSRKGDGKPTAFTCISPPLVVMDLNVRPIGAWNVPPPSQRFWPC